MTALVEVGSGRQALVLAASVAGCRASVLGQGQAPASLALLALGLAIGLVVDDGIVVLENIFRYMEMGKHPMRASIEGLRDILFPLIATTTTLALVFGPVGLVPGQTGALFDQFAFPRTRAAIDEEFPRPKRTVPGVRR